MSGKIFMFLFVFALLYIVFQFSNSKKGLEMQEAQITELSKDKKELKREKDSLVNLVDASSRFSLLQSDKAKMYIEDRGFRVEEFNGLLQAQILDKNSIDKDNPLVPYQGMDGNMAINAIKLLNHKWGIAEFTDGKYWGEFMFKYFINEDKSIDIEVTDSFIYTD
ncbi:hydrolase [Mesonia sp. MT50]|uniref:Hydrolase n=1 Tax=Mesonia profundi TaxID=3070998 RepID=A0ABU1A2N1_9FLAO|nr:hydrolase [Mesonia profundi]MDQ7917109.1 hydrolase [Mesonia profundi]